MPDPAASDRARTLVVGTLGLSLALFALHVLVLRPYSWPAGAGITTSGDLVMASLSEPRPLPRIRPPSLEGILNEPIEVTRIAASSDATQLGLAPGTPITESLTAEHALQLWRDAYRRGPTAPVTLTNRSTGATVTLTPQPVWRLAAAGRRAWLDQHLSAVLQMVGFLAGAVILVALGSRGITATLMTLALVMTAMANAGALLGAEFSVPLVGGALLVFGWTVTALSFPIIGLAVLHFPSRAPVLERFPWINAVLLALPAPVLIISVVSAAFLLGADSMLAPLTWFATNSWLYDASFSLALGANVLIVIEGVHRYRTNLDVNERRRIQIVVYTGVPAVFAYAIKAGVPLVTSLLGRPVALPMLVEGLLQLIVLSPALALPYAVAVKHVFSPRTVLRRSLQYALARRTLSVLILLPIAALVAAFISERDRPLGDIILGQPLFYVLSLVFVALGLRYRDQAQRALDRRFFRAEYDAREILVALANRVPYEDDPSQLVSMVTTQIDNALHPESIAVLAGEEGRLEVLSSLRTTVRALTHDSGLATLLQWSEEPLEIFLDEERSPGARLPAADRAWLSDSGISLLVPIFAGTAPPAGSSDARRPLVGVIALGHKRSEEPYTPEDRKLLSGIAAQMSVALDLSRMRKRASSGTPWQGATPTLTPTMVGATTMTSWALAMCPVCRRCYDLAAVRGPDGSAACPDDSTMLQPVIGMPTVVDGKYRVEFVVGRGGMGAVFRARDVRLGRDVAIKVVRADLVGDAESRARFQREAQIVARLQHPAIVTVFDYGALPDGAAFLVMEFVRGEDLRHLLKREKTLPPSRAVELVCGVAAGVEAAHRAGVLHRDLKPENILLPASATGPKVLDFGVAKLTDAPAGAGFVTQGATIVGTPAYMAPEQLRGESVDVRADVYSLAVLTYEALTSRLPFGAGSFIDVGIRQVEGATRVAFDGMPVGIAAVLQRALSLDREARPATAAAFAEALRLGL